MLNQRQLGARIQLSKVYLIHEGTNKEDSAAGAAQQIFRSQGVWNCVGIEASALIGDFKDERRAGVFQADGDLL